MKSKVISGISASVGIAAGVYFTGMHKEKKIQGLKERIYVLSDHFQLLNHWLELRNEGKSIASYFEREGYAKYDRNILQPILYHIAATQLGFMVRLSNDEEAKVKSISNRDLLSRPILERADGSLLDLSSEPELSITAIF